MASYAYLAERDVTRNVITPVIDTLIAYMPDSLILGTGLYAFLTLSFPLMFLFLFELESLFLGNLVGKFTRSMFPTATAPSGDPQCKSGYFSALTRDRLTLLTLFGDGTSSFPSRPLYLISSVFGYLTGSLLAFQDVIRNLDDDFQLRLTLACAGAVFTLALLYVFYLRAGCTSFLNGMGTMLVGLFIGAALMILHRQFFGLEAVNFLGLPTLVNKTEKGSPIYVCAPASP